MRSQTFPSWVRRDIGRKSDEEGLRMGWIMACFQMPGARPDAIEKLMILVIAYYHSGIDQTMRRNSAGIPS
jgi:hypothetical protein